MSLAFYFQALTFFVLVFCILLGLLLNSSQFSVLLQNYKSVLNSHSNDNHKIQNDEAKTSDEQKNYAKLQSKQNQLFERVNKLRYNYDDITHNISFQSFLKLNNKNSIPSLSINSQIALVETVKLVVNKRTPCMLTNLAKTWSFSSWDIWSIAAIDWPILSNIISINRITKDKPVNFIIEEERDVGGMINFKSNNIPSNQEIIPELFFVDFLLDMKNYPNAYFYSTNYRIFEGVAGLNETTRWRDLLIIDSSLMRDENTITAAKQVAPLINFLYPGCSLQARYSEYHIMRVQTHGIGRYILYPPVMSTELYLFPSIHLSAFQSQVDIYDMNNKESFPSFQNKSYDYGQSIVLHPGQVLYIPPYWTAHSEAITLSITIDILSISNEQFSLAEAYNMPIPFDKVDSFAERVIAAKVFLVHVLSRVNLIKTIRKYSRQLYKSRFSHIYPENGLFLQKNTFSCYNDEVELQQSIIESMDKERVIRAAQFVSDRLNSPLLSPGIGMIWLNNYVEQIARWAMNDADSSVVFILECLNYNSKIDLL
eukprot:gene8472-11454_t